MPLPDYVKAAIAKQNKTTLEKDSTEFHSGLPDYVKAAIKAKPAENVTDIANNFSSLPSVGDVGPVTAESGESTINNKQKTDQGIASFIAETASNVPESAYDFGKNIFTAVTSPVDTVKSIGKAAHGLAIKGAEKISELSGNTEPMEGVDQEAKRSGEAVIQFFADRYGGKEQILETIKKDPVGFLSDVSILFTGGGAAVSKLPGMAKVGSVSSKIGKVVDPITVVKKAVVTPLKAIPDVVPQKLYGSAMKMSTVLKPFDRAERIRTGLDNGIMPSQDGLDKLQGLIDSTNNEIKSLIDKAAKSGDTIDSANVTSRLKNLRDFADNTIDPPSMHAVIDEVENNFTQFHGKKIPVDKAQKIKQNTYTQLRKSYGELKSSNIEAQKQIARGIKEELAAKYPELSKMNAKESSYIKLEESLERAVARITNRDVVGIGAPIKVGTGVATGSAAGIIAGISAAVIEQPGVKAALAIALNKVKKVKPKPASKSWGVAYQSGRVQPIVEDSEENYFKLRKDQK